MTPNPQAADTGVSAEVARLMALAHDYAIAYTNGEPVTAQAVWLELEGDLRTALLAGAAGGGEPVAWLWEHENAKGEIVGNGLSFHKVEPTDNAFYHHDAAYKIRTLVTALGPIAPPPPVGAPQGVTEADLPPLPQSFFRVNAAPHAASHGVMLDAYRAEQVRQAQREAYAAGLAARPAHALATIENGPWKSGVEYLPYHPDASHVRPDFRDGWNACYRAALATPSPAQAEPKPSIQRFNELMGDDKESPIERLRFFCSLAMNGQDWLDVEPFFDALITATGAAEGAEPTADAERDVLAERRRQIEGEGWTEDHDNQHNDGDLAKAAACYALHAAGLYQVTSMAEPPTHWPWSYADWKPKDFRRDLVRAAALMIAEIAHHDAARAAQKGQP